MAEELKCALMSTPKYNTNKSRRMLQDDKLHWSPDSIVAHGNLTPLSRDHRHGLQDCGDQYVKSHHPPWGDTQHYTTPPTSSSSPLHPNLHLNQPSKFFATPSVSAQRDRAAQLGIRPVWAEASFEGNQSFPKVNRQHRFHPDPTPADITMNRITAGPKLEALQGDGMNDISFSSSQPRKKYFPRQKDTPIVNLSSGGYGGAGGHKSLSESWSFSGLLEHTQSLPSFPSSVRNPNKAICTIAASTSEILTANNMACELFGCEENELVGRPLKDLLRLKSKEQETITESHLEPSGQIISLAGKVVEVMDSHGLALPISLWVKRLDATPTANSSNASSTSSSPVHQAQGAKGRAGFSSPSTTTSSSGARLLCVMEPVERTVGHVQFDAEGEIQWCDDHMAQLCGFMGPHQVTGLHMTQLIPAFHFPDPSRGLTKDVKKQRATGRTRDGMSFPLSIVVRPDDGVHDGRWVPPSQDATKDRTSRPLYLATVWVFANISGLISLRPDGTIHSLNENFARLLFGYSRCELIGHSISKLIPNFFDLLDLEGMPLPPLDDDEDGGLTDTDVFDEPDRFFLDERGSPRSNVRRTHSAPPLHGQSTPSPSLIRSGVSDGVPVTSTPCRYLQPEEPLVSSEPILSRGHDSKTSLREESCHVQIDSQMEATQSSPLHVHNLSSSTSHTDDVSYEHAAEGERKDFPASDRVHFSGSSSKDLIASTSSTSHRAIGGSFQDVDNNRLEDRTDEGDGSKSLIGYTVENKDAIGQNVCASVVSKSVIGPGFADLNEIKDTIDGEENRNNSSRNNSAECYLEEKDGLVDCQLVKQVVFGHNSGEDNSLERQPGYKQWQDYGEPLMGLDPRDNVSDVVIDCDDVNVDFLHCDKPGCDDPKPSPSPTDELNAILSPIKPYKPHLFDNSFTSNTSDDSDGYGIADTTAELLTAKVAACDISDLVSSEDEGQSSGQGVVADVSGNVEDSLNQEAERLRMGDGRKSRLSHANHLSLRTKLISGGLDSASTTSDDSGPLDEQLSALLPHTPSPRSLLDTSGTGDATYLEDESSYFSRDGASLSNACTESSASRSSNSGMGVSDHSVKGTASPSEPVGFRQTPIKISVDSVDSVESAASRSSRSKSERSASSDSKLLSVGRPQGQIPEGSFSGQGRHKDGGSVGVVFQIRRVTLADGSDMLLLWTSRDPEEVCEASRSHCNLTLASSLNSMMDHSQHSLGELLQEQANSESKLEDIQEAEPHDDSPEPASTKTVIDNDKKRKQTYDDEDDDDDDDDNEDQHEISLASAGEFSEHYVALSSIGKGAFGFVKLGRRRRDRQEVVVKFIRRAKVLRESWVKDANLGVIPMEVFLLTRLDHPNIVKVLDVYQNADFIQLVMERHGTGMDLFEFIDRNPRMDEPLTSYIFKQMVSGVAYLHGENIVHRDIKDENIIIDEHFNIKLIDFGAATYMLPGRLFGTFCGTIEYCSPEVLQGNKYQGPELEMWSLGITLYTLIFGENPFFDVEETLQGVLKPPSTVSRALMFLITWLLHPDPLCRATISDLERNSWVNQNVDISKYQWERVLSNTVGMCVRQHFTATTPVTTGKTRQNTECSVDAARPELTTRVAERTRRIASADSVRETTASSFQATALAVTVPRAAAFTGRRTAASAGATLPSTVPSVGKAASGTAERNTRPTATTD